MRLITFFRLTKLRIPEKQLENCFTNYWAMAVPTARVMTEARSSFTFSLAKHPMEAHKNLETFG
jgi:hypothetical protein